MSIRAVLINSLDAYCREWLTTYPPPAGVQVYDWYQGGADGYIAAGGTAQPSAFPSAVLDDRLGQQHCVRLPLDWAEVTDLDTRLAAGAVYAQVSSEYERVKRLIEAAQARTVRERTDALRAAGEDSIAALLGVPVSQLRDPARLPALAQEARRRLSAPGAVTL